MQMSSLQPNQYYCIMPEGTKELFSDRLKPLNCKIPEFEPSNRIVAWHCRGAIQMAPMRGMHVQVWMELPQPRLAHTGTCPQHSVVLGTR